MVAGSDSDGGDGGHDGGGDGNNEIITLRKRAEKERGGRRVRRLRDIEVKLRLSQIGRAHV